MKKHFYGLCLLAAITIVPCTTFSRGSLTGKKLSAGFRIPPPSIQTTVYWYWVADHISEEGIIKDLYAMKKAGINRAFIGNIGYKEVPLPGGQVKFRTEAWWKALHTALKTASKLDIEIGIFNGPGWSQAGGPWVIPDEAMRYLASVTAKVTGGKRVELELPKPGDNFRDVKVIAFPDPTDRGELLNSTNCTVTATPGISDATYLIDGDMTTEAMLVSDEQREVSINFTADKPFTIRSIKLFPVHRHMNVPVRIEVKEGGDYRPLAETQVDRYNSENIVGFDPFAPIAIAVPETTATEFRIVISQASPNVGFKDIALSSVPLVERYLEKSLAKMYQQPLPYWHDYMWREQPYAKDSTACVPASQVLDISGCLNGDRLVWNAPAGNWTIMRTGMMPTGVKNSASSPEGSGLEVDKMSKQHVASHFESYMAEIHRRIPAEDRKTWKVIVQDSYETGGQNFTDEFIEEFRMRYGYDPVPFLPVYQGIVVENEDISNRFLWDLRRLIADKVAYDYVGGMREISHKYGLTTWLENYGHWGFPAEFLQYGGQSDEVGGEFWAEGHLGSIENRAASSCAHIYGKTKVSSESFTSSWNPFARHPAGIKRRADRFFSEGVNNSLLHVYIHQPYEKKPGLNAWFGTEFNRNNIWFSHMDLFSAYLKRVNFMLQQGVNIADVAYFIGEDTPKMTGINEPELPTGYQFDYINAEVIKTRLSVRDNMLTLPDGTQYKILVLPPVKTMRPELLAKIASLVEEGAIVLGPAPERSPSYENYPHADHEVAQLAERLWSGIDGKNVKYKRVGKGMVINGMSLTEAFALTGCPPDCKIADSDPVLYGHRTAGQTEIYFLTNQSDRQITVSPEFRVRSKQPELWEPVSGITRKLAAYTQTGIGTIVPLQLAPNESVFIVFRNKTTRNGEQRVEANYPKLQAIAEPDIPWTVHFEKEHHGPEQLTLRTPIDLSKSPHSDVRHYSGKITYRSGFSLNKIPPGRIYLDIHEIHVMAKVWINGKYAGGVWTPPYRIDITDLIHKGVNRVEVEVVNTWVNRLIGDAQLPEAERTTWTFINQWGPDSNLPPSGLVGPVVIGNIRY